MHDLDHPVYAGAENFDKKNALRKDTIVTMGPPKRLSGIEIANMLVKLVPDSKKPGYFKGTDRCITRLIYVDYGSSHMCWC
jgi:hypothetical protein